MDKFNLPVAAIVSVNAVPYEIKKDIQPAAPLPTLQNPEGAKEFLSKQGWPEGLIEVFIQNVSKTPLRFFVCDDSGSMYTTDGNVLYENGPQTR